jgi:hypothetical protein
MRITDRVWRKPARSVAPRMTCVAPQMSAPESIRPLWEVSREKSCIDRSVDLKKVARYICRKGAQTDVEKNKTGAANNYLD